MPEYAEFACFFVSLVEGFDRTVYADELVILGDDFLSFVLVDDEVFSIVEQFGWRTKSVDCAF